MPDLITQHVALCEVISRRLNNPDFWRLVRAACTGCAAEVQALQLALEPEQHTLATMMREADALARQMMVRAAQEGRPLKISLWLE